MPVIIIKKYWKQVIGVSLSTNLTKKIESIIQSNITKEVGETTIRALQVDRTIYIQIYLLINTESSAYNTLQQQDNVRASLLTDLTQHFSYLTLDVIFTHSAIWVSRAVNTGR